VLRYQGKATDRDNDRKAALESQAPKISMPMYEPLGNYVKESI